MIDPTGRAFEDLQVGDEFVTGPGSLTGEEIIEFASRYDPQLFHLDADYARDQGPFGTLVASGWQTLGLSWALWCKAGVLSDTNEGGVGTDNVCWPRPVLPGDEIHARVRVGERRITSKGRGLIRLEFTVLNQDHDVVMEYSTIQLVTRRDKETTDA